MDKLIQHSKLPKSECVAIDNLQLLGVNVYSDGANVGVVVLVLFRYVYVCIGDCKRGCRTNLRFHKIFRRNPQDQVTSKSINFYVLVISGAREQGKKE